MEEHCANLASPENEIRKLAPISCGKDAAKEFGFDRGYRNLNHGSFGTYPTAVRSALRYYQDQAEARPDAFIRYEGPRLLDESRAAAAKLLNAPVEACVFTSNATVAFNTVLRNLVYQPGDVIVFFATIYGACEKTVSYITETTHAESAKIKYTYPVSDDSLCDALEKKIEEVRASGKNPRVAIFDTVVSLPGVLMPFERLTEICKRQKVLSCIDGAHGIGHIPLDLSKLDPDFFFSNCHKWLHVPRGCSIFYVPVRNQHLIRSTLPTSHGFVPRPQPGEDAINNPLPPTGKSEFVTNFEFVGTMDDAPYFCVPAALEWRSKLRWNGLKGEEAIMSYTQDLARKAGKIVSQILGTKILENAENTLGNCSFSNVSLLLSSSRLAGGDSEKILKIGQWIVKTLVDEYDTFIAIIFFNDEWWMRLSAQVYLTEKDFEWAGRTLKEVCARVENGEWNASGSSSRL